MMELSLSELQGWFLGLSNKNTGANGNVIGAFPASVDVKNNTTSFWYSEITGYALSLLVNIIKQDKNSALSDCKNTADKAFEFLNYVATQSKKIDDIDSIFQGYSIEENRKMREYYSFDVSMCIQGVIDYYNLTGKRESLELAEKLGNWLLTQQTTAGGFLSRYDGINKNNIHEDHYFWSDNGALHAKNAIALFKLSSATGDKKFYNAALKVLKWVISLQDRDGSFWVNNKKEYVYSHVQCYALEGLLYAKYFTNSAEFDSAITKGAGWLLKNIDLKYMGILGVHKFSNSSILPEGVSSNIFYRIVRRYLPRKEFASDATFQTCRIFFLYDVLFKTKNEFSNVAKNILEIFPNKCIVTDAEKNKLPSSRIDISIPFIKKKSSIVSVWSVMFAIQAYMLRDKFANKDLNVKDMDSLF